MYDLDQARIVFRAFVRHLLHTPRAELDVDAVVEKHLPAFTQAILDRQLLRPKQVEAYFPALNERMLREMRYHDRGPAFAKVHGRIFYRMPDILAWVERHMVRP